MPKVEDIILELTAARGPEKSICPSEAARRMGENWQSHLTAVRRAAIRLAEAGLVQILRKGQVVAEPAGVKGVIRLRMVPPPADDHC